MAHFNQDQIDGSIEESSEVRADDDSNINSDINFWSNATR